MDGEIERMAGLLNSLREVAPAPLQASTTDLNAVVTGLGNMLGTVLAGTSPNKVNLVLRCASEPLPVRANPDALKQILTNLIKNATESFVTGGDITLTTKGRVNFMDQVYTQLIVADNGAGIEESRMHCLFTQTGSSKGGTHSGTGLVIVKRLVDELQGKISCQSDSNGTAFSILLPQAK